MTTSKKTKEEICTNCGKLPDKNIQKAKHCLRMIELYATSKDEKLFYITELMRYERDKTLTEVEKIIKDEKRTEIDGKNFIDEHSKAVIGVLINILNKLGEMKR